MGSLDVGFAGTLDRFGTIRESPLILDIKTGQLHDAALSAQMTGYYQLLQHERGGVLFAELYALKLSNDGTYQLAMVTPRPGLLGACITLHHATERKKRT